MNSTRRFIFAAAAGFVVAACSHQAAPVAPAPSAPDETVRQFLAAVNANDLGKMSQLWGTERGPASVSSRETPDKLQQRLAIMQRYLQADSFRVRSVEPVPGNQRQRRIQVDLMRGRQRATVPFVLVPARTGGWLVSDIDLNAATPLSQPGASY